MPVPTLVACATRVPTSEPFALEHETPALAVEQDAAALSAAPRTLEDALLLAQRMTSAIALPVTRKQWTALRAILAHEYTASASPYNRAALPGHNRVRLLALLAATLLLVRSRAGERECLLVASGLRAAKLLLDTVCACFASVGLACTARNAETLTTPRFRLRVLSAQERALRGLAFDDAIVLAEDMAQAPALFEQVIAPVLACTGATLLTLDAS